MRLFQFQKQAPSQKLSPKQQALVYSILPPIPAVVDYATGLWIFYFFFSIGAYMVVNL